MTEPVTKYPVVIDGAERGRVSLTEEPKPGTSLTTDDGLVKFEVYAVAKGGHGRPVILGSFLPDD